MRRIVTGHDKDGVAQVILDNAPTNVRTGPSGVVSTLVWCTDRTPADIATGLDIEDMGCRQIGTPPPPNGTRLSVVDFPPGNPVYLHRTETIDYAIVLSGKIDLQLDNSIVTLQAGDIAIQRGTNHAWLNRGKDVARVAFVLIDAVPLGIGRPLTDKETAS